MSRIHEALKKAEQDKSAALVERKSAEDPAASNGSRQAVQVVAKAEVAPVSADHPASKATAVAEILQLEELRAKCTRTAWNPDAKFLVFSGSKDFPTGAEQFRTLRSRLYRIRETKALNTLLITSSTPAEGKTFVSANLAQALVRQHGCRVLLIDADLRAPRLHQVLGVPPAPGLAEYLQGGRSELEIIQKGQDDELYFIQAGSHVTHPAELISNGGLKQLLARVSGLFDWILLDTPPVLPVSDAVVSAALCDGVLFVVRAGSTPAAVSQKACQQLQDASIVGVVLNSSDDSLGSGTYYQYASYGLGQTIPSGK
jgi:protein-tyrosine kinase